METYQNSKDTASNFVKYTIVCITVIVLGSLAGAYIYFNIHDSSLGQKTVQEVDTIPLTDEEMTAALDSVTSVEIRPSVTKANQTLDKMQKPKTNINQKSISNALESLE